MQVLQSLGSKSCSDKEVSDIIPAVAVAAFTAAIREMKRAALKASDR